MTAKVLFVIVPSITPTGPIKGAIALCNGLRQIIPVSLIALKPGSPDFMGLDSEVSVHALAGVENWGSKIKFIRDIFKKAGGRRSVISLSMCFSADLVNFFMRHQAVTISWVRGNLPRNYRIEFGRVGPLLALLQFCLARKFDHVIAMSKTMSAQLKKLGLNRVSVIGNFLDEDRLNHYRAPYRAHSNVTKFVFLGRLSAIKCPEILVDAVQSLNKRGIQCALDMVGDGPLRLRLEERILKKNLEENIRLLGHLENPFGQLQSADVMILPSASEGISRAVMESLYFGVPCIVRNVDSNSELVQEGYNGWLFHKDCDLPVVMEKAVTATQSNAFRNREILLPSAFRQHRNISRYVELMQRITSTDAKIIDSPC